MRWIALIIVLGALVGCAEGPPFVTGKTRAEIPVETVTLYLQPPPSYETVGLVSATPGQQDMGIVAAELRSRAAKMGANGVLLHRTQFTGEYDFHLGRELFQLGGHILTLGIFRPRYSQNDQVKGVAIYVPQYR